MVTNFNFSLHDYDSELGSTKINGNDLTAANFDALLADAETFRLAASGLLLGAYEKTVASIIAYNTPVPVTNKFAQRETRWLVEGKSAAGNFYSFTMPMADLGLQENKNPYIFKDGSANVTLAGSITKLNAFLAAYSTFVKSPYNEAMVLWNISHVGRNS